MPGVDRADVGGVGAPPLPPPEPGTLPDPSTPEPAEFSRRPRRNGERRSRRRVRTSLLLGGASLRERRLGTRLDLEVASVGSVLHGCRIGDAEHRIDHIVVVPTGVWIVIADHTAGPVAVGTGEHEPPLRVGGVDAGDRVSLVELTADRVRGVLVQIDMDWVDVVPSLCFTNARVRNAMIGSVRVVSPRRLVRQVGGRGPLLHADARRVAGAIGRELVVDGDPTRRAGTT